MDSWASSVAAGKTKCFAKTGDCVVKHSASFVTGMGMVVGGGIFACVHKCMKYMYVTNWLIFVSVASINAYAYIYLRIDPGLVASHYCAHIIVELLYI